MNQRGYSRQEFLLEFFIKFSDTLLMKLKYLVILKTLFVKSFVTENRILITL